MNEDAMPRNRHSVVDVRNVSMAYKLFNKPIDMLKEVMFGGMRHDTFWALRNIDFEVNEGDRVGIIGHNGAGKSTLLQIIAGNLQPTTGTSVVTGRISSLLSMVPAWNGEDSGLENIKFNLLVQGIESRAIPALIEDIIDFTDLGPFIHQPVKTYSAGMSARLSFAIATAINPEILIVDEVLGAGDGYFAGRAARRMQKMCDRGKALLFVSHSTGAVRMMCNTCVWMENGQIRMKGPVETVVRQYEEDILRQQDETMREGNRRRLEMQRQLVTPEEVGEDGLLRFRIRPEAQDPRISETHYVRDVKITIDGSSIDVPIEGVDLRANDTQAALDIHSCEWGRIFERQGVECRALLPRTGVRNGGHFLVKPVRKTSDGPALVEATFCIWSENDVEPLTLDYVNIQTVEWQRVGVVTRRKIGDGWTEISVSGSVFVPELTVEPNSSGLPLSEATSDVGHAAIGAPQDGVVSKDGISSAPDSSTSPQMSAMKIAVARAKEMAHSPVTISQVVLEVDGRPALSVKELQPFSIRVSVVHHEPVPTVSINLNLIRSDGAYVFYQPSGLDDNNILNFRGSSEVVFHFDPNPFGCGDYEANVFATNGFSWQNIPISEVYDRSIGRLLFKVHLGRPIAFGLVNIPVPVTMSLTPSETERVN